MHIRRRRAQRRLAAAITLAIAGTASADTYTAGTEAELIQVINYTNTTGSPDTVNITADITLTAQLPLITEALTIVGSGGRRTIRRDDTGTNACSPTATNAFRLIDAGADLTLQDLTLTGGCNLVDQGGAVRVEHAALSVVNSTISGNQTFYPDPNAVCYGGCIGGGLAVLYGSASISDSTIMANKVNGYSAAGGGVAVYQGDLTITHSTISGNRAGFGGGGGIYAVGTYPNGPAGTTTIVNSTISGNTADSGGGFCSNVEAVTIEDSRVTENQANGASGSNAQGGGIVIFNRYVNVTSHVTRTLISDNVATAAATIAGFGGFGGGVDVLGGAVEMTDSAIVNNSVTSNVKARAGAVMIENAVTTISNSTLSGNSVSGPVSGGGAIMVDSDNDSLPASLDLRNSTVTGNSSNNSGGGIYLKRDTATAVPPSATIASSIMAGNQGESGLDAIGAEPATPATVTTDHSLIQGAADVGTGMLTLDATTLSLWNQDPQLLPLAYNGGTTPTHALAPNSPAIDQGTNSQSLANDQRGAPFARVVGVAADIGAYELDVDRVFANGFE